MPEYSQSWMCEAYKLKDKIRMAVWRMDEKKDTIEIPLKMKIEDAKILYPSSCKGSVSINSQALIVTLNNPCTAVVIEATI